MSADPKPARKIRDRDAMKRAKLLCQSCAVCGTSWHLHVHHVVYRSHSGDDVPANLACLCEGHHQLIHRRHPVTWLSLRRYIEDERPDTLAYLQQKVGDVDSFFRV